jgi:hypothetical protein
MVVALMPMCTLNHGAVRPIVCLGEDANFDMTFCPCPLMRTKREFR